YTGMSKSGLYAHFGSKEELQIATIRAAKEVVTEEVRRPALEAPDPLSRLTSLCDRFLSYVQRGVFPGGCFFASVAAEFDTRPGPVRNLLVEYHSDWIDLLTRQIRDAQEDGSLAAHEDPEQLAFEINALLHLANDTFLLCADPIAITR